MKTEPKLYQVSDTAFNYLVYLAINQNYTKPGLAKIRGMSEFLEDLAYCQFTDTRPETVVERHNIEISIHRAPKWTSYVTRRARMLTLTDKAITSYITIAYQFGIMRDPPYSVGGPSITRPMSVVGYVLEGIGLRWLTPTRLPVRGLHNDEPHPIIKSMES